MRGVVVAAAILDDDGNVLVAQRAEPPHLAGWWELPGGKVEPDERDEDALVRECREELGVTVRLDRRIGGTWPAMDDFVLRAWTARVASADDVVRPLEHAAVRWVPPAELGDVDWLPSDHALAAQLEAVLLGVDDEVPLQGGNVGGAIRVGRTVRRPCGPWTPAVHALMRHVASRGVPGVPRVLGIDDQGREVTEFIPGDVTPSGPWAPWALTDTFLGDVGHWLAAYHEAVADFPADGLRFRFGPGDFSPGELICHNDVGPHNLVGWEGRLAGVLDWDTAGPSAPMLDLAYTAWGFALADRLEPFDVRLHRLRVLNAAYGAAPESVLAAVEPRILRMIEVVEAGAAAGDEGLRRLVGLGEMAAHAARLAEFREERPHLERRLSSG
ncbi:MAG: NUDIX domain-containing protein [Streptosporangiales bacterium]|nr:NUDIX domain-containing protein [Streptosporangiales bacterium]